MTDKQELMEEIYRRYLKGDILDKKLSYITARGQIIDELKMKFEIFIKELKEGET